MPEPAVGGGEHQGDAAAGIDGGGWFAFQHLLKVDHGRLRGRDLLGLGRRQGRGQEHRQQYANGKDSVLHDRTSSDFVSNLKIYPNYLEVPSCKAKLMGG